MTPELLLGILEIELLHHDVYSSQIYLDLKYRGLIYGLYICNSLVRLIEDHNNLHNVVFSGNYITSEVYVGNDTETFVKMALFASNYLPEDSAVSLRRFISVLTDYTVNTST